MPAGGMPVTKHRVLVGIDYTVRGQPRRAEPGEVVTDLPKESLPWLLEQNIVEPVAAKASPEEADDGEV